MFLYSATMFLSAFLLFLIQPMLGKYILPWFGGTPAVWTTCMLFFQAVLLGGYGYAHALASRLSLRKQSILHITLISVSLVVILFFSILPSQAWKPSDGQSPIPRILGLLLVSIGAPYLILAASSPLLQSWFSRTRPGTSPYRLYALSNLGSLLALLAYPFLIEPAISLSRQSQLWSWAYGTFALLCVVLAVKTMRCPALAEIAPEEPSEPIPARPQTAAYSLWIGLSTCSSIMLLATTSMICQDLAVIPLLWILPLALYLLTFILCFQFEQLYWRPLFLPGFAGSIAWTCHVLFGGVYVDPRWQVLSFALTLFAACMVCHGELVRLKPHTRYLTSFYLAISGGGVLGALLVTVAAPHLLKGFWEYHFGLLITALLALTVVFIDRKGLLFQGRPLAVWFLWAVVCSGWIGAAWLIYGEIWKSNRFYMAVSGILLITIFMFLVDRRGYLVGLRPLRVWTVWLGLAASWVVMAVVLTKQIRTSLEDCVEMKRDFFGVLQVLEEYKDNELAHRMTLMHGRIEHGFQYVEREKRLATSYFGQDSGIGVAIRMHPKRLVQQELRIAVIGLGTGTLATYGTPGDTIRFYEINPDVVAFSDKYFSYLKDSAARIDIELGDARVSLERERQRGEPQNFDVLAVDAFNSDAIPVHLLTRECFQTYRYHLAKGGILALHISNRYFDLKPVVRNLIQDSSAGGFQALYVDGAGDLESGTYHSDWILLTENQQFISSPMVQHYVTPWKDQVPPPIYWTDDYSNLFRLLIRNKN